MTKDNASLSPAALDILSLAEEDWYGLYEIFWRIQGTSSGKSRESAFLKSKAIVKELLRKGLVELSWYSQHSNKYETVRPEEMDASLNHETHWHAPTSADKPGLGIHATEQGKSLYLSNNPSRL
jgi:hypothetical protein